LRQSPPKLADDDCFEACASDIDGRPAKTATSLDAASIHNAPGSTPKRGERRNLPHVEMAAAGKHFGDDALVADLDHLPD